MSTCFANKIKWHEDTSLSRTQSNTMSPSKQLELTAASVVSLQGRIGRPWQVPSKRQQLSHLTELAYLAENFNDDKMICCVCKKVLQSTKKLAQTRLCCWCWRHINKIVYYMAFSSHGHCYNYWDRKRKTGFTDEVRISLPLSQFLKSTKLS